MKTEEKEQTLGLFIGMLSFLHGKGGGSDVTAGQMRSEFGKEKLNNPELIDRFLEFVSQRKPQWFKRITSYSDERKNDEYIFKISSQEFCLANRMIPEFLEKSEPAGIVNDGAAPHRD